MKIFTLLSILILLNPIKDLEATQKVDWYAQVLDEDVYLHKEPTDTTNLNLMFMIEPTYFVRLLESANSIFYKVEYLDIIGYIKKTEVQVVKQKPQKPFLENINFRIFSESSQQMRTVPYTQNGSSSQVYYLPYFSKDAIYYGKVYGEDAIEGRTKIWYYCKYIADKPYYGYIYSDGCDQMTSFSKNTEICEYVDYADFDKTIKTENLSTIKASSPQYKFLIILVCIPVAIFVFMIVRSSMILKSNKKEKAKEIKLFFDS